MINWIIIIILIVVGILAVKMNHLKHRAFIIAIILMALFFYLTLTFVTSKNNVNLSTYDGFINGMKIYGGWLANGFGNLKEITGNAINMDWTGTNSSFFDKKSSSNSKFPQVPVQAGITVHK